MPLEDIAPASAGPGLDEINRKLRAANSRFQAMYDQGVFAGSLDLQGRVTDANRASLEVCGYRREDVLGKLFWECGWWNRSPQVSAWMKNAIEGSLGGESFRGESSYFWADGSEHLVDFTSVPIKNEAGQVDFVFVTGMDVTDRLRLDRDRRATEVLESISEGFLSLDEQWRFDYLNPAALRILDATPAALLGHTIWEAYPGLEGTHFERAYKLAMVERRPTSFTAFYPHQARWYEVSVYPAPRGISVYFRNVTELKEAEAARERALAESEKQRRIYEAALSNTPDFVYVIDLEHRLTWANDALVKMWGRGDVRGKRWLELGYEPWHAELHDGEIDQVIATRKPIRGEVPFTGTGGRRVYDYIFVPVFGEDGEVVAIAGTTRDITERQRAEQDIRELAEQLTEADRAKDEFLATLSHELRNPLAPLRNSLQLLRMLPADNATRPIHEMMGRQVNHLVRLVDDLLEISRISRGTFELRKVQVEVAAIVRNAVETSHPLIEAAHHELKIDLPAEPVWLEGDPVRLAQILANLLNNAAKYTPPGGHLSLTVRREADVVAISVRDDGSGISPGALPRMFEMFSRGTRSSGMDQSGLGVGLSLARRLATMHGGSLEAHSEGLGKGSEFTVRLPVASSPGSRLAVEEQEAARISQRRILVVDDNRDAAESLAMVLKFLGADVRVARDGPEAIETFAAYSPSVVLLDIGMPGMDGYEVARTLRRRFPEKPATLVALTGWGQDDDRRLAREAGFDHHLIKPAEIASLQGLLNSLAK